MDSVSVIIPTFNRVHTLGATLDSIIEQKYQNWECLVIDDGSNDYTKELMSFYCKVDDRIHFYQRPKSRTKGANSCRNYGFELSNGEYVNWFDSDDLMHPDFLKIKINELIKNNTDCSVCINRPFEEDKASISLGPKSKLDNRKIFENICLLNYAVPTHAPLWKRSFLMGKILFNEKLTISQDLEFHSRILESAQVSIIKKPLFYIRRGHENITSELYLNMNKHFESYFWVRKMLLSKFKHNQKIFEYYRKELMGIFRYLLTLKEYNKAKLVLNFLYKNSSNRNHALKLEFLRIYFIFHSIRIFGKGETKLKRYLYLSNFKN